MNVRKCVVFAMTLLATVIPLIAQKPGAPFPSREGPLEGRGINIPNPGYTPTPETYNPGLGQRNPASEHVSMLGFISRYARDIGRKHGRDSSEVVPLVKQIEEDVKFLRAEWSRWGRNYGGTGPLVPLELDPYYRSLRGITSTLKEGRELSGVKLVNLLQNVARDLRNKATNCRNSADGLGKQIVVSARTLQGRTELAGFEVFYVPMALLSERAEHKRFPTVSSPATHSNIPPGYYAVWLRLGNTTNVHTAFDILGDQDGRCSLEVSVPEGLFASQ